MALLNIPTKSTGDELTANELNSIVTAIRSLQGEKGFGTYFDTQYTSISPQVISSGSYVSISNNKANVIEDALPIGVTTLYDGTKIVVPSINTQFQAYISFFGKTSTQNNNFEIGIDIDGGFNEIFRSIQVFTKGTDTYEPYSIKINGYMAATYLANGGIPKIKVNSGNMSIYGATLYVGILSQPQ